MTHENKFGMFIHWGVYAMTGIQEQVYARVDWSREKYEALMHEFNPVNYEPEDHIHDNNGMEDVHMFPYTQQKGYHSTIDWERFLLALKEIGYEGPLAFETFRGVNALPKEVQKEGLQLVSAIGRYFRTKIVEDTFSLL